MTFQQWLIDQYHAQAMEYRRRLQYEVSYCKRVHNVIDERVKNMLHSALKEVQVPPIEKWDGNKEDCMQIWLDTPKPNYKEILKEFMND